MAATIKKRTVVYFDPAERESLEKLSERTGAPIAELVRRAVSEWLMKRERRLKRNIKGTENFLGDME